MVENDIKEEIKGSVEGVKFADKFSKIETKIWKDDVFKCYNWKSLDFWVILSLCRRQESQT